MTYPDSNGGQEETHVYTSLWSLFLDPLSLGMRNMAIAIMIIIDMIWSFRVCQKRRSLARGITSFGHHSESIVEAQTTRSIGEISQITRSDFSSKYY